jgi:hypothetical protein
MKLRHQRTEHAFMVFGPKGVAVMDLSDQLVFAHWPAPDDDMGASPCPLLEMRCDATPLPDYAFAGLLRIWQATEDEAAVFAGLEAIYMKEFM